MGKKYVPDGVFLACDKGTCPSTYKVRFHSQTHAYSAPLASELDIIPFLNIKPMGFCMVKGMCTPMPLPWTGVKTDVLIHGRLLLEDSKSRCLMGGEISIHFTRESANQVALWGGMKMPTEYIKEGFDWMAEQTAQSRKIRDESLPDWAKPIAGFSDWMSDFSVGLVEGAVNGVVGLGETVYQVVQDPVGTAEALYGMGEKGVQWATDPENWQKTATTAWNWASDGSNWTEAVAGGAKWVTNNPRGIGNGLGEFIPDAVAAVYTGGSSAALSGTRVAGKEVLEETAERAARQIAKEGVEETAEAGAKKIGREAVEDMLQKADGEIPLVKTGDDVAEDAIGQNIKHSSKKPSYQHGQGDGGPGTWENRTTPNKGADYQQKVTGAPNNTEYVVKTEKMKSGEKKFDGYDPETNTLIDAKDWDRWPPEGNSNFDKFARDQEVTNIRRDAKIAEDLGSNLDYYVPTAAKKNQILDMLGDKIPDNFNVKVVSKN